MSLKPVETPKTKRFYDVFENATQSTMEAEATQLWANPRVRTAFIRIAREIAEKHRGLAGSDRAEGSEDV